MLTAIRLLTSTLCIAIGLCLCTNACGQSVDAEIIRGYWVMPDGSALLEIYAAQNSYEIRIMALREQHFTVADGDDKRIPVGTPRRDIHNPDASLRSRPLIGLTIATDLRYRDGAWQDGKIYDPGSGRTYNCRLQLVPEGFLRLRAYIGFSLLGRTMYWQPAGPRVGHPRPVHDVDRVPAEPWNRHSELRHTGAGDLARRVSQGAAARRS